MVTNSDSLVDDGVCMGSERDSNQAGGNRIDQAGSVGMDWWRVGLEFTSPKWRYTPEQELLAVTLIDRNLTAPQTVALHVSCFRICAVHILAISIK